LKWFHHGAKCVRRAVFRFEVNPKRREDFLHRLVGASGPAPLVTVLPVVRDFVADASERLPTSVRGSRIEKIIAA
jgi:hypothetical protein